MYTEPLEVVINGLDAMIRKSIVQVKFWQSFDGELLEYCTRNFAQILVDQLCQITVVVEHHFLSDNKTTLNIVFVKANTLRSKEWN